MRILAAAAVFTIAGIWLGGLINTQFGEGAHGAGSALNEFPPVMLWAWERPEDLRFIDPDEVGVAFLAETLYLVDDGVVWRPRMQPLRIPDGAQLMAVVRIEMPRGKPPALSDAQREAAVRKVVDLANLPKVIAVQVDFDARASQRAFYRALLTDVRERLPKGTGLSMTALASWCVFDDWIRDLPVDEAVPMVFSMGMDTRRVRQYLDDGSDFRDPLCRMSTGVGANEGWPRLKRGRRVYVFNKHPWTQDDLDGILRAVKLWH